MKNIFIFLIVFLLVFFSFSSCTKYGAANRPPSSKDTVDCRIPVPVHEKNKVQKPNSGD